MSFKCLVRGLHLKSPVDKKSGAFEKVHLFRLSTGDFSEVGSGLISAEALAFSGQVLLILGHSIHLWLL